MAWVQYWFRVLSLKFCGKSKKNCGDISQVSPAFCMYAGPIVHESMLIQFPSDMTTIGEWKTAIASRQISKRGSTSAARNSALTTLYTLCHSYSDLRIHQVPPNVCHTYSKFWANCYWVNGSLGYFWWFLRGREPRLCSEISDFVILSVLGDFYALYHFVCHRYR